MSIFTEIPPESVFNMDLEHIVLPEEEKLNLAQVEAERMLELKKKMNRTEDFEVEKQQSLNYKFKQK